MSLNVKSETRIFLSLQNVTMFMKYIVFMSFPTKLGTKQIEQFFREIEKSSEIQEIHQMPHVYTTRPY